MFLLESLPTVIGTAAIAPALLLLWLVIAADERPGPPLQIWTAFLLGAASISLLGLARAPFMSLLAVSDSPQLALASAWGRLLSQTRPERLQRAWELEKAFEARQLKASTVQPNTAAGP